MIRSSLLRVVVGCAAVLILGSAEAFGTAYQSNGTGGGDWSNASTWSPSGVPGSSDTVTIVGSDTVTVSDGRAVDTVTMQNSSGSKTLRVLSSGALNITGAGTALQVNPSTDGINLVELDGGPITVPNDVNVSGGALGAARINFTSNGGTLTVGANLSFSGTAVNAQLQFGGSAGTVNIGGNLGSGGSLTTGGSFFIFNGSGAQSIYSYTFHHLTINKGGGTATIGGGTTFINGTLTIADGILDDGGNQITMNGASSAVSIGATGRLNLGGVSSSTTFPVPPTPANITIAAGGIVQYQAGGGQTVATEPTYQKLYLATLGPVATRTFAGTLTVQQELQILDNGANTVGLDVSSQVLDANGDITGDGNLSVSAGGSISLAGSIPNTINFVAAGGSSFTYDGNVAQTVGAFSYRTLTINKTGTAFLSGATSASGGLTVTSGTLSVGSNSFTATSNVQVDGTLDLGSGTFTMNGGTPLTVTANGTVTGGTSMFVVDGASGVTFNGTGTLGLHNFDVNNTSNAVDFLINATANGFVTLDGGRVNVNNPKVFTISTGGSLTRTSGWFTGLLALPMAAATPKRFEIGTPTSFLPVDVTPTSAGTLTMQAVSGAHPSNTGSNANILLGYWKITTGTVTSTDLTFNYNNIDVNGCELCYVIGRYDGSLWNLPGGSVNTTANTATITAVGAYVAEWTLGAAKSLGQSVPSVVTFSPSSQAQGSPITIYGSNFTGTTALTFFNGVNQPTYNVVDDNTITANVPAGASTGPVQVTNGAGSNPTSPTLTVTGPQNITSVASGNWSNSATWSCACVPSSIDNVTVDGETVTIDSNVSIADLTLSAGDINGSSTLTVTNSFTWTGGSLTDGTGTLALAGTATSTISGATNRNLARILTNAGTLTLSATGQIQHAGTTFNNTGTFNVTSNATWNQTGSGAIQNNNGANFNKTTSTGTATFGVPVTNNGSMSLTAGLLHFSGTFTNTSTVTLGAATSVGIAGGGSHSGSFSIAGTSSVELLGGTTTFSGTFTGAGTLRVSGGTLTASGTPSGDNLDLTPGGTIDGSATLIVNASFDWTGGTLTGSGSLELAATATSTISSTSNRLLSRQVQNLGTLNFSATGQIQHSNWTFENYGTMNLTSAVSWNQTGSGAFTNVAGANLNKTTDTGTSTFGVGMANHGTITVSAGTLSLISLNNSGTGNVTLNASTFVTIAAGGTHAGTYSIGAGSVLTYTGGTVTFSGTFTGSGALRVNGGTLTVSGTPSGDNLDLDSGMIDGTGTLTVNASFDWTGGTLSGGAGALALSGTSVSTISGGTGRILSRNVTNAGTLTFSATGFIQHGGATFTNNGTFTVTSLMTWNQTGSGAFVNDGSGAANFNKTTDTGTSFIGVAFNNNANMSLSAGTLSMGGTFNHSGAITLSGSAILTSASGGTHSGTFSIGSGSFVTYTGGTTTFSGTFTGAGALRVNGGTLTVSGTPSGDNLDLDSGMIDGGGTLTINGSFDWTAGTLSDGSGTLALSGTCVSTISGLSTRSLSRIVTNAGTLTFSATGPIQHAGAAFTNSGTFNLTSSATWNQTGSGSFVNSNTFNKTTATGTSTFGVAFDDSSGTLNLDLGKLSLAGTVTFNASSTVRFGISGTSPMTQYGVLELTGALNPLGTLAVSVQGGHVPSGGAAYPVMAFASRTGTFPIESLGFGAGRSFSSSYTATSLSLIASGPTVGSVSPNQGSTAGNSAVTITGTGFQGTTPGETFTGNVKFDTSNATSVQWQSSTTLTAVTPAHAAGPVSVTVTNVDGQPGTLANAFTYVTPVTSVDVTTAADAGAGSLREAITQANSGVCAPNCTITFSIGSGLQTINLASPLPTILAGGVTIDGTTQEGYTSAPLIDINGSGTSGQSANGLVLDGGSATVKALIIRNFTDAFPNGAGIFISNTGNTIKGCYIGTNAAGTAASPNRAGIVVDATSGNTIGGTGATDRNVISGNTASGISIENGSSNNTVLGNYIGTDVNGSADVGNGFNGVSIEGSSNNTVGGSTAAERNVISGNDSPNVLIGVSSATGNVVKGNYIGVSAAGTVFTGNGDAGVMLYDTATGNTIGGVNAGEGNVVSGNNSDGIVITDAGTTNNLVQGNICGLNPSGTAAIANTFSGIAILNGAASNTIGGTVAGARNVSSGNSTQGIAIVGAGSSNNVVKGNYTGLNAAGTSAIANGLHGIAIWSSASGNTVGGSSPADRNVTAGNTLSGVALDNASNNIIAGNYVGLDATGATAIPNAQYGVEIFGGSTGNTIGGALATAGNRIEGHTGTGRGIKIYDAGTSSNLIQNNTIKANAKGVVLASNAGTANRIAQNQISANTTIAIDLNEDGPTANDGTDNDTGPNNLQNFPVLANATLNAGTLSFNATIDSSASGAGGLIIEVFKADTSSPEQALTYLERTACLAVTLSSSPVSMSVSGLVVGDKIVATATTFTDGTCTTAADGTSELSAAVTVATPDPHWASPVSGSWNDPTKWSTGAVPLATDTAYLDAAGTYTVTFSGTDRTVAGVVVAGGATLTVSSNTLTVTGTGTVDLGGSLALSGGTLAGAGAWTINGGMNWTAGTLNTTVNIAATRTLAIAGSGTSTQFGASGTLQNSGNVNWSSGTLYASAAGAVINNLASGTFDIQGDLSFSSGCCSTYLTINNAGTFTKSSGSGTSQLGTYVAFNMSGGSANVNAGTLEFAGGASFTGGTVSVPVSSTLKLASNTTFAPAITLTAPGTVHVSAGTVAFNNTYSNVGTTLVSGGTLSLANAATTNAFTFSGGTLGGAGSLTVNGNSSWTSGTLATTLTNPATRTLTIAGSGSNTQFAAGGRLDNSGTVNWTSGSLYAGATGTVIDNNAGATFDIQGDLSFSSACCSTMLTVNNAGTFTKSAGTGLSLLGGYIAYNQTGGTTSVSNGILELNGGGSFTGGTVNVPAPGTLRLSSNATFAAAVTLSAAGTFHVSNGTVAVNGAYSNVGTTLLSGGTMTLANASSTNAFTLSGGQLGGAGSLTVNGASSWTSGILATTLTNPATRTLTITGSGTNTQITTNGRIDNSGTVAWTSGTLYAAAAGAIIDNNAGATFDIQGDLSFSSACCSTMLTINNAGAFTKSAGAGTSALGTYIAFNMSGGTANVNSGILELAGGASFTGGTVNASSGTTLRLSSNATFAAAVTLSAPGTVHVSAATTTFNNAYSNVGTTLLSGGTLSLANASTTNAFTFSGGTLSGAGDLTVNGSSSWTSGTLALKLTNPATRTLTIAGSGTNTQITTNGRLDNSGTVAWTSGTLYAAAAGAIIDNNAGATFDIQGDLSFSSACCSTMLTINNAGAFTKSAGAGSSQLGTYIAFNQSGGTTNVNAGTLELAGGASITGGAVNVSSGTTLRLSNTATFAAAVTLSAPGTVHVSAATTTFNNAYSNVGTTAVSGGTLSLANASTTNAFTFSGGTLAGAGSLTVNGNTSWTSGTLGTTLVNPATRILSIAGSGTNTQLTTGGTLQNSGTVNWTTGDLYTAAAGAVLDNLAGGVFDIQGDLSFSSACCSTMLTVNNAGTLRKSAGTGTSTVGTYVTLNQNGVLDVRTGTLHFQAATFVPSGASTLHLWLTSAATFSRLTFGANAFLGGTLNINYFGGFTPATGNTFPVVTFASNPGPTDFAAKTGLSYGSGTLAYALNATNVTLTAGSNADVSISKTAPASVTVNQTFNYTITVNNAGPDNAASLSVTDTLPAGVTYNSTTAPGWSCSGTTSITCTLGSLAPGSSTITVNVTAPGTTGPLSNTANLAATNDSTGGNNSSTANTNVTTATADLALTKTANFGSVSVGGSVTYSIVVTNNGPLSATGVTVTDNLPPGQIATSATWPSGTCTGTTNISCAIGALANGANVTVTIVVTANSGGTWINTANVTLSEADPNLADNSATATVAVTGSQTLTVVSNANSGNGSLAQAILDANAGVCSPSPCNIYFNLSPLAPIPGPMPALTAQANIDGMTQPGYSGTPLVEIDGSSANPGSFGLSINSSGSLVTGLSIHDFGLAGSAGIGVHPTAIGVRILSNSFNANTLATDLGNDGPTANDASDVDSGANNLQNFPVVSSAVLNAGNLTMTMSVDSPSTGSMLIQVYRASGSNGQLLLGTACRTTPLTNDTFAIPTTSITAGQSIVTTATSYTGAGCTTVASGTSEFSAPFAVTGCTLPDATITAPASVCAGTTGHTASVPVQPGVTYAWSITNGTITSATNTNSITFTAGATGTTTLNVTVTAGPGCASSNSHNAAIAPVPVATITAPASACANSTGNAASVPAQGGATYNWTITNGTITSATNTNAITFTAGATGSVVLGVTVTLGTCSTNGSHNTTITPLPSSAITAPASTCPSAAGLTASVPTTGGATYAWSITNGTITSATNTNAITFTAGASGTTTLNVTVTASGCTSSSSHNVTITANPTATISAPSSACANAAGLTASVPPQAGATYAWSITNGTITSATNLDTITFTAGATGTTTLNVTVTASGCTSAGSHNVTISPPPNATISVPASVCANSAGNAASVPSQAGATYNWTITNGTITSATNTNAITFTAGASGSVVLGVTVTIGGCSSNGTATVTTNPLPPAAITAPASTCPSAAGLTASVPTTAGATYAWSITNGTITSATNTNAITFTAGASGTTTLNVTVTASGCTSSSSHNVTITANPTATITAPPSACANAAGLTASVPPQAGATYAWSITNGTITSATNVDAITFTAGATGTTTLNVTVTASGCTSAGSHNVTISPPPNATISAPASVCANSAGNAASVPSQAGATYNWTITNGTITSATNTNAITFTAGASGSVVLGVTVTIGGCSSNGTATVTTNPLPSAAITAPASTCPSAAGLTASVPTTAGATYAWSITNGTITSATNTNAITFTAGASGTTTLNVTVTASGCTSSSSHNVTITANPTATITAPPSACANAAGLTASVPPQAGATYAWSITNGTITSATNVDTITFTAGATGTTTLNVTVTASGCTSAGSHNVTISPPPNATISAPAAVCANSTGNAASVPAQGGATYNWTITNGTITSATNTNAITFTAGSSGSIVLGVTVTIGGCSSNGTANVTTNPLPSAAITAPASTCPSAAGLTASVPTTAGATYAWSITNGTITSATNTNAITFTAGASGTTTLNVTVTASGCTSSSSHNVTITANPTATISAPPSACANTAGLTASVPPQAGATYAWSITNGTITSATNVDAITFTAGATGTTTLNVTVTASGCTSAGSHNVTISPPPNATISVPASVCANSTGNAASVPAQGGATYNWTITNGTITSATNTNAITFTAGASGSVVLGVTVTIGGCSSNGTATVTTNPLPSAAITALASTCPSAAGLTASVPTTAGATYAWSITNGTITSATNTNAITFTAGASGTTTLNVTVTASGCTSSSSHNVTITANPTATITAPPSACANAAGLTASVPPQAGATYAWSITNGTITSATNLDAITFTAGATGTTTLNVTVTASGCTSAGSHNVTISPPPNATISAPASVCANSTGNAASVPAQGGATYNWTITNGTITSATNTNAITFTAGASGSVVLGVTVTIGGCSSNGTATVTTNPLPSAAITAPASTCPSAAGLTASVPTTAGATYAWSITNGTITSATNTNAITFTAGASGTTTLNGTVTASGCTSSSSHNVTITANPTATITAPNATCANSPGNTAIVPPQAGATYAWTITNGTITSSTTGNGIAFTAGASGTTTVNVTVTANGCTSTGSHTVTITPPPNATITAPASVCANSTGNAASVPAQAGATYGWTITNGTITSATNANAITFDAGPSGNVTLGVTVTIGGCSNSGTATVTTTSASAITITAPASTCPSTAGLTASVPTTAGATYAWSITNGTITSASNTNSITFTAGASGTTTLNVTVTSSGCTSSATHNVTIAANPAATITAPANVCSSSTGNNASVAAQAGATYAWTITGGTFTSATNTTSVTFTAGASGNVGLGVTVTAGSCTATGSATIPIVAALAVSIAGPNSVCPNQPFTLDAGPGFTTYAWSNGAATQTITVAQGTPTTYTVTVTSGGCSAQASKTVAISATPVANLTAPGTVDANSTGNVASVPSQAGATYAWTINGGTITAGQGTNSITFSAGASGTIDLSVVVTIGSCTASASTLIPIAGSVVEADLTVTKSAPATVNAGQTFVYTIEVINNGPSNATNVSITDELPAALTLVGVNSGWPCTTTGNAVRCSGQFAVVGPNAPIAITVRAPLQNVTSSMTVTNTAAITSGTADPNTGNNTASATTQIIATPTCATTPPSLNAPADNATGLTSPVTFSWTGSAGATFEVWLESAGTTSILGTTTASSLTASVPSGTSAWFVVQRPSAPGCDRLVSTRRTFTVAAGTNCATHGRPQINSPAANATVSGAVTIAWTPVPQAIGYRVWMSVGGEAAQDIGATDGALSLTANVPPGTITVYVQALFSGCPPTESDRVTFTVAAPDPCATRGTTTLLAPANNATVNSSSVEFRWSAANNAEEYRLWASFNGAPPEVLGVTEETSLRRVVGRGDVVWWIEIIFDGCASIESARFRFTIPTPQVCGTDRPNTTSPGNNATVTNALVTFTWTGVDNSLAYELWLTLEDGSPTLIGTTTATSLTREVPPGDLEWFVRARVDRCDPRESAKSKFTYVPPASCANNERAVAEAPENGDEVTSPVSFRWSVPAGATRFEVYVIRGENPPALAGSSTTDRLDGVSLATGRVRWFVRAFFGASCPPLDSVDRNLSIIAPPQACAPLDAPVVTAPGQISSGVPFRIRWSPIAGATSYQLLISNSADFANAESITTSGTEHELVRTNNGAAPVAVYARVRAIDARCTVAPSLSLYGPTAAIFILPAATDDPSAPSSSRGIVTFTIELGPELAGQTFTAVPTQPWLNVSPASGVVGPTGTTLTVTANTATLPLGASLGGIAITTTTPTTNGVRGNGTTTTTKPVTISLVTPVAPANRNTPPPDAMIIPAVANADGFNAHFQSDVRVTNASAQAMKYQLTFTPTGEGLTASKQTTITIDPGRTVALDDVLKTWFGTGGTSATGTLEVRPLTQTSSSAITSSVVKGLANLSSFASSRTFNATANGTFGQYIPAIPFASFVGKSNAVLSLQQIAQSSQYRTNLGLLEANGEPASLLVTVFGQNGQKVTSFPVELKGGQHTQLNSFLAAQGINSLNDGRIEVQVTGGNGKVTAYASVLDNATADPLLVTPVALSDEGNTKWVVPGVADLRNGLANWQTDLRVFNASTNDVDATLSFYSQNGGEPKTATITIPAGQVRELDKTLTSVFNAPNDGGAVHISTPASARLIATARTYNQTTAGTYGQFISAVTPLEAAAVGTRALQLLQVEESARYRSNIGLAEVSGKPVTLEVSMISPDAKVSAFVQVDLGPNEFRQLGGLLRALGNEVHNARVTVRAISGEGRVAAYASVIDMVTQDPTYVPAQ